MENVDISILIPRIIKRIRLQQGLSQEELALRANLDRTYISGIERGVRNVTIMSLAKVLSALGIDIKKFALELMKEEEFTEDLIQKKWLIVNIYCDL